MGAGRVLNASRPLDTLDQQIRAYSRGGRDAARDADCWDAERAVLEACRPPRKCAPTQERPPCQAAGTLHGTPTAGGAERAVLEASRPPRKCAPRKERSPRQAAGTQALAVKQAGRGPLGGLWPPTGSPRRTLGFAVECRRCSLPRRGYIPKPRVAVLGAPWRDGPEPSRKPQRGFTP